MVCQPKPMSINVPLLRTDVRVVNSLILAHCCQLLRILRRISSFNGQTSSNHIIYLTDRVIILWHVAIIPLMTGCSIAFMRVSVILMMLDVRFLLMLIMIIVFMVLVIFWLIYFVVYFIICNICGMFTYLKCIQRVIVMLWINLAWVETCSKGGLSTYEVVWSWDKLIIVWLREGWSWMLNPHIIRNISYRTIVYCIQIRMVKRLIDWITNRA